jgi:hypothetical protein
MEVTLLVLCFLAGGVARLGYDVVRRLRRPAPDDTAPPPPPVESPLTPLEAALIRKLGLCAFCGGYHTGLCRRVVEVWYFPGGGVKHAVLAADWETSRTVWPEDLPDE